MDNRRRSPVGNGHVNPARACHAKDAGLAADYSAACAK